MNAILTAESLPRERRGKAYDMRPLIEELSLAEAGAEQSVLHMRLSARPSATGRPEEVLEALGIPPDETRIERTRLIFKDSPVQ